MTRLGAASLAAIGAITAGPAHAATPTFYGDRTTFETDITFSVTDDYMNPGYQFIQGDVQMSGVLGETDYMSTGFMSLNIVNGGYYCAGCNGSFELSFLTTSVGTAAGVDGVGVDIVVHDMNTPYYAYITYADGTTDDIALPSAGNFWGVSAPERIERIDFGLSMGGTTTQGSFGIDNLIIGDYLDLSPCGDGIAQDDEECDEGGETATCDANCTLVSCGDDTPNVAAGEACDDGGPSATCNADCTLAACGDGIINMAAGETCDDSGETATCDDDCTSPMCGDLVLNVTAGEACDGGGESPDCDPDCTAPMCGDGYENNTAGEYCDDGNNVDGDGCSATCMDEAPQTTTDSGGTTDTGGTTDGGTTTAASGETGIDTGVADTAADTTGGGNSETGGASGSASATGSASESGGAESSGGGSGLSGGSNDTGGGCGCTTSQRPGLAAIAWLGLAAVRRRRRRRAA